jgi:hypothetical protein
MTDSEKAYYDDYCDERAATRAVLIANARPFSLYQEFDKCVALDFIIKNLFARGHTSHLFGPPGSGKSALLGSAAVCLGSQPNWYGFKIKQNLGTVFFPFERSELIKKRTWAQCQRDGIDNVPIVVAEPLDNLMHDACVNQIIGTILAAEDKLGIEIGLAGFDTVNKGIALGKGDEDKAWAQNRAWGNLRRVHDGMARYHGVHLAGIGHTGKDENRGARGSNAAKGDNDLELQVSVDGAIKSVAISKANELPEGPLMRFRMEAYDTGMKDDDGDPIEVWIPAAEKIEAEQAPKRANLSDQQRLAIEALAEVTLTHGVDMPPQGGLPHGLKSVVADQWKQELFRRNVLDKDAKNPRARFNELRTRLASKKLIGTSDDLVWLATNSRQPRYGVRYGTPL